MKQTEALILLNAYRMGVVPHRVDQTGLQRQTIQEGSQRLLQNLKEKSSATLLIQGEYGSGKSHALAQFKHIFLDEGFLVAHICIDNAFNLSKPEDLYYHLMHHLSIKSNAQATFEDIFGLWLDNLRSSPNRAAAAHDMKWVIDEMTHHHETFAHGFLQFIRSSLVNDTERAQQIASWIKGDLSLPAHIKKELGVKGNVNRSMAMDFLKAFLHLIHLMGYPGLILLIDELDLLKHQRVDRRECAFGTLRQLIDDQFNGSLGLMGMVLSGTPEIFYDTTVGFKSYPPLAQRLMLEKQGSYQHSPLIHLNACSIEELYAISEEMLMLFQHAYQSEFLPTAQTACHLTLMDFKKNQIGFYHISLRQFIQNYIGLLDDMRKKPHQKLYQMKVSFELRANGDMHFTNRL